MPNFLDKLLNNMNKTWFKIIKLFNFSKKSKKNKTFKIKDRTKIDLNKKINTKVIRINTWKKPEINTSLFIKCKNYINDFNFKEISNLKIKDNLNKLKSKTKERHTEIKSNADKKQTYLFTSNLDSSGFETDRQSNTDIHKFYKTLIYNFSKKSDRFRILIKSLIWMVLISISLFIILYSSIFELSESKIIIERLDDWSNEWLIKESLIPYIWTSIFKLSKEEIKKDILKYQKNINSIYIDRLPLNWLRITIESHKPLFKTRFKNRVPSEYLLLENWVLIRNANNINDIPVLDITSEKLNRAVFLDYEEAVPERLLVKIFLIYEKIFNVLPEWLSISKMHYFQIENEIHITLSNKIILFFDLSSSSIDDAFNWLLELNKQLDILTQDANWIIYINLWIMPSIAVCDEWTNCYNNLVRIYWNDYK